LVNPDGHTVLAKKHVRKKIISNRVLFPFREGGKGTSEEKGLQFFIKITELGNSETSFSTSATGSG